MERKIYPLSRRLSLVNSQGDFRIFHPFFPENTPQLLEGFLLDFHRLPRENLGLISDSGWDSPEGRIGIKGD